jgi:hypothetical protein
MEVISVMCKVVYQPDGIRERVVRTTRQSGPLKGNCVVLVTKKNPVLNDPWSITLHWTVKYRLSYNNHHQFFFFMAQQPLLGQGLLIIEASRSHSDTAHLVGLLWTSDKPVAEISTDNTQHSQERDIHAPGQIRTRNPSKRAAAAPRLRPRGRWDRHSFPNTKVNSLKRKYSS